MLLAINSAAIAFMKADLARMLPDVKSSHRCEALARGLGFHTYASLLAACKSATSVDVVMREERFTSYLLDRGYKALARILQIAAGRQAMRNVMERTSQLTICGVQIGHPERKKDGTYENRQEFHQRFLDEREILLGDDAVEQFLHCLCFLSLIERTKTIRPVGTGSYRLKHIAENYASRLPDGERIGPRYISNGCLIAAAIHAGFNYKMHRDELGYYSVNVTFNMPKAIIDDLECEFRPDGGFSQDRRRKREARGLNPSTSR